MSVSAPASPPVFTSALQERRSSGKKLLACYVVAADPDLQTSVDLVCGMADAGADIIELGVPFSDPMVDGEEIQAGHARAIASAGGGLETCLQVVRSVRARGYSVPILLMGYMNSFMGLGWDRAAQQCAEVGIGCWLIVDLPVELGRDCFQACARHGLANVLLVSPTTTETRLVKILSDCSGFIYLVSYAGVTGRQRPVLEEVGENIRKIRAQTDKVLLVGFGIRNGADAARVGALADGLAMGSALVGLCAQGSEGLVEKVASVVAEVRLGLDGCDESLEV